MTRNRPAHWHRGRGGRGGHGADRGDPLHRRAGCLSRASPHRRRRAPRLVTTLNVTLVSGLDPRGRRQRPTPATTRSPERPSCPVAADRHGRGPARQLAVAVDPRPCRPQAPYAAAHQLMERVHELASSGNLGLDTASLASDLDAAMQSATGCARTTVFVEDPDGTARPAPRRGRPAATDRRDPPPPLRAHPRRGRRPPARRASRRWATASWSASRGGRTSSTSGRSRSPTSSRCASTPPCCSTTCARSRRRRSATGSLARCTTASPRRSSGSASSSTRSSRSATRRRPASSLGPALRDHRASSRRSGFSIFDLRHEVTDDRLSASLADYSREVSHATGVRVHLSLAESGPPLSPRHATEVLRVAQEAIGNVRKHARARTTSG